MSVPVLQQGNSRHAYQFCKELLEIKPDLIRMKNNLQWFEQRVKEEDEKMRAEGLPVLPEVSHCYRVLVLLVISPCIYYNWFISLQPVRHNYYLSLVIHSPDKQS